ncbi:MAG: hypothetical protein WC564_01295 [Patescibacteria group bacterium]
MEKVTELKDVIKILCIIGGSFLLIAVGQVVVFFFSQEPDKGIGLFVAAIFGIVALVILETAHQRNKELRKLVSKK